jgi:hypothetical protein
MADIVDEWEQILGNPAIEKAAIAYVIECERQQGRAARDARGSGVGGAGDVESDGRIIEVKAFSKWGLKSTGLLLFTPGQLREVERNENYYVYIVENVGQGDHSKFELRELHGADLQRLLAGAKPQRFYVPVRAAEYARLSRLCVDPEPHETENAIGRGLAMPAPGTNDPAESGESPMAAQRTTTGAADVHDSLRGLVISRWEESGRPHWDLDRTIQETESADAELARRGQNPAHTLRTHRLSHDDVYVRSWTKGCRFPWLSPAGLPSTLLGST